MLARLAGTRQQQQEVLGKPDQPTGLSQRDAATLARSPHRAVTATNTRPL